MKVTYQEVSALSETGFGNMKFLCVAKHHRRVVTLNSHAFSLFLAVEKVPTASVGVEYLEQEMQVLLSLTRDVSCISPLSQQASTIRERLTIRTELPRRQ